MQFFRNLCPFENVRRAALENQVACSSGFKQILGKQQQSEDQNCASTEIWIEQPGPLARRGTWFSGIGFCLSTFAVGILLLSQLLLAPTDNPIQPVYFFHLRLRQLLFGSEQLV